MSLDDILLDIAREFGMSYAHRAYFYHRNWGSVEIEMFASIYLIYDTGIHSPKLLKLVECASRTSELGFFKDWSRVVKIKTFNTNAEPPLEVRVVAKITYCPLIGEIIAAAIVLAWLWWEFNF